MKSYPLVFCFRDLIAGRGFVAAVATKGRVVLAQEDEGWTLYGVNPGGLAGGAEDQQAAFADFRQTFQDVLDDIAHEARSFAEFKNAVQRLVLETNDHVAAEWESLRERVRDGSISLDLPSRDTSHFRPSTNVFLVGAEPTAPNPDLNQGAIYSRAA